MTKFVKQLLVLTMVLSMGHVFSQKTENDTLNTDVVNVVKPYTPTISDAFKIKETPNLNDSVTTAKKTVDYTIFSNPVASTFTPAKGKAAVVDKAEKERLFDNYASLGVGTYTTVVGELYLNHALNRTESLGGYINHHSSGGGIDGVLLDDGFINSKINLNYKKSLRDYSWNLEAGYQLQVYNWYGLSPNFFDQAFASGVDPKHAFNTIHVSGDVNFDDAIVDDGALLFRHFTDDQGSAENRFAAKSGFDFQIGDHMLSGTVKLDYLSGSFDKGYYGTTALKYSNFQVGFAPSYQIKNDDLTVDFGASFYYMNDLENSDSKFFIYPNIQATYRLVDDVLIVYGGVTGGLIQNSYYNFAQDNPFVSPTLLVVPTDQQYNGFVGLKGKVSNAMSYNIKGRYFAENNKALFKNNLIKNYSGENAYDYGNSFGVVYDDVSTISLLGELNVDVNRHFTLGLKAEYFIYNMDRETEAWNLPDITGSLFMDYQIDTHWFAGVNLFYVGERKAMYGLEGSLIPEETPTITTLDSYFDANARVGYKINDQFSVYVKANNIANQDYQRFVNYPVQGIQFLAGLTYKFDF